MRRIKSDQEIVFGQIIVADEVASPLPLEHTHVQGQITGPAASVTVKQQFTNPFQETAELAYLFPLSHEAAVVDFELRIGERIIKADLQEVEQAKEIYQKALQEGKQAGLLKESGSNLFSVKLANVRAGESIETVICYQERVDYRDGEYEFVFPMGITPKYHRADEIQEGKQMDAPVAGAEEKIGPVEISIAVNAGTSVGQPDSPSHKIDVSRMDEHRFSVQFAEETIPDHDFVLRYAVAKEKLAAAAWHVACDSGDYIMATLLPPAMETLDFDPKPREFVFVLDRSGSMSGEPIAQARNALRACLRSLNPQDTFRILLFDHEVEWYDEEPGKIDQNAIDRADQYLEAVTGRGGTEIVGALGAALTLPDDSKRTRFVVFLTDGAVSAESKALDEVRRHIGQARLFTFGIGPSVNRLLLSRLAKLGRGASEFLQLDEDIEEAILRFQDRVSFPVLTDINIEWKNGKAWDVYPVPLPDLYLDQPLEVVGRFSHKGKKPAQMRVSGVAGDKKIEMELLFGEQSVEEPALARLWARARLDYLIEEETISGKDAHKVRSEIIGLALEYNLISPYTAFVAVDVDERVGDGKPKQIMVSQPLPQGLDIGGFGPPAFPTALSYGAGFRSAMPPASAPMSPPMRSKAKIRPSIADQAKSFMKGDAFSMEDAVEEHKRPAMDMQQADILPWLARTQRLNGSWNDDIEFTSVAVLCFVCAGHTTHRGHYRRQLGKAVNWLLVQKTSQDGVAAYARAAALLRLAAATAVGSHQQAAETALAELSSSVTPLEQALKDFAESRTSPKPAKIQTEDDIKLTALAGVELSISDLPKKEIKDSDLIQAWVGLSRYA